MTTEERDVFLKNMWTLPRNEVGFSALVEYIFKLRVMVEADYRSLADAAVLNEKNRSQALIKLGELRQIDAFINLLNSLVVVPRGE